MNDAQVEARLHVESTPRQLHPRNKALRPMRSAPVSPPTCRSARCLDDIQSLTTQMHETPVKSQVAKGSHKRIRNEGITQPMCVMPGKSMRTSIRQENRKAISKLTS